MQCTLVPLLWEVQTAVFFCRHEQKMLVDTQQWMVSKFCLLAELRVRVQYILFFERENPHSVVVAGICSFRVSS